MGYFGYAFVDRTPDHVKERRILLDWYANLAQLSQLLVLIAFPVLRISIRILFRFISNDKGYHLVSSPRKRVEAGQTASQKPGWAAALTRTGRILKWYFDDEVFAGWGTYGQWFVGTAWAVWLMMLCVKNTTPGTATSP
jgi:hypothetical protein